MPTLSIDGVPIATIPPDYAANLLALASQRPGDLQHLELAIPLRDDVEYHPLGPSEAVEVQRTTKHATAEFRIAFTHTHTSPPRISVRKLPF